ncbi:MAG: hypothetical protein MAGBODY4_01637 [Candidatus Marinimicrobia bacterium]|nr:hypothetical protein [Candidatus Neomarinimicrobiota bacterium]
MKFRTLIFLTILVITPLGFGTKFYYGPGEFWIQHYGGGVFYEIFWILVVTFLIPKVRTWLVAFFVFLSTSMLELLQLWHPPFLESLRSHFIGATVLGVGFDWWDFLYYVVGCFLGYLLVKGYHNIVKTSGS